MVQKKFYYRNYELQIESIRKVKKSSQKIKKKLSHRRKPFKSARLNYSPELFDRAIFEIRNNGLSQREAARKFEIPLSTLNDAIKGVSQTNKLGKLPVLSDEIEAILV